VDFSRVEEMSGRRLRVVAHISDDWVAEAVVGPDALGRPRLHEVALKSGTGTSSAAITASLWRQVKLGDLARAATDAWRDAFEELDDWRPDLSWELRNWPGNRGRRPVPDRYYALLSQAFEERLREGSREPLNDLSRWLDLRRSTVDRRITEARKRGLLERAGAAPGGQDNVVTERGREALEGLESQEGE
jgi:hypothetical protein